MLWIPRPIADALFENSDCCCVALDGWPSPEVDGCDPFTAGPAASGEGRRCFAKAISDWNSLVLSRVYGVCPADVAVEDIILRLGLVNLPSRAAGFVEVRSRPTNAGVSLGPWSVSGERCFERFQSTPCRVRGPVYAEYRAFSVFPPRVSRLETRRNEKTHHPAEPEVEPHPYLICPKIYIRDAGSEPSARDRAGLGVLS